MNKRKKSALIAVMLVVCMLAAVSAFMIGLFTDSGKSGQVIALYADADSLPESVGDAVSFAENIAASGYNTVIRSVNSGRSCAAAVPGFEYMYSETDDKTDLFAQLKKQLSKKNIQLYISVDCAGLDEQDIIALAEYVHDSYRPAAIVIDNCNGRKEFLADIKKVFGRKIRKTDFILQTDDIRQIKELSAEKIFDGFIGETVSAYDYSDIKGFTDKPVLLHYNSQSLYSDMFVLTNFSDYDGAVINNLDNGIQMPYIMDTVISGTEDLPVFDFSVTDEFNVTYPLKDLTTYYKGIFVTGTGKQGEKVFINDVGFDTARDGTFGIYIELEEGENTLQIEQGDEKAVVTVTRKVYSSTGSTSSVKYTPPFDETMKVGYGQTVQTTGLLTSMLADPDDDSAIIANLEQGTKLIVTDCVQTTRNGKSTWAYRMSNGGFVLASKTELLNEVTEDYVKPKKQKKISVFIPDSDEISVYETPVISAADVTQLASGDEIITVKVNSSPAVLSEFTEEKLTLHFLDTVVENPEFGGSAFFTDYKIKTEEDGTYITFNLSDNNTLWGYDISCTEDAVRIYLKKAPQLKQGNRPLEGVTIMLDSGHGGYDSGALGVASTFGPLEKDLNLAVAKASKALLEQYGADVILTRDDDTYLSLDERRNFIREIKPDLFISVHHNSMDYSYNSSKASGSECYYFTNHSKKLAENLADNISASTNRRNRGASSGYYYVTRTDIAPSALMEYGFMINPAEFSKIYTDKDIYKAAFGTLQAVLATIPE